MSQEIKSQKQFPFLYQIIKDQFNENNNFLESKDEALSPLDDDLDDLEFIDGLQKLNIAKKIYRINSNVIFVSSRTVTDSDTSVEKDIFDFINNFNVHQM